MPRYEIGDPDGLLEILPPDHAAEQVLDDSNQHLAGLHLLVIGDPAGCAHAIPATPAGLGGFARRLTALVAASFPGGPLALPPGARAYEGHVTYADGSRVSLQCHEGRHGQCPDTASDDDGHRDGSGPLDGYYCECTGCLHDAGQAAAPAGPARPLPAPGEHAPLMVLNRTGRGLRTMTVCSCGQRPTRAPGHMNAMFASHMAHRRGLKLPRADYSMEVFGEGPWAGWTWNEWQAQFGGDGTDPFTGERQSLRAVGHPDGTGARAPGGDQRDAGRAYRGY